MMLALTGPALAIERASEPAAPASPIDTGYEERVTVQLVQINFIAVDKSGRPVVDLKPEEIEIIHGRERQTVAFLQPYYQPLAEEAPYESAPQGAGGRPEPTPAQGTAPTLRPDTTTRRWFLLVFDNYLTSPRTRLESIEAARSFVSQKLGPLDRVGIAVFDGTLQVLQNYTSDQSKLLGALTRALQFTEHAAEDRSRAVKGLVDSMEHCATAVDAPSRPLCAQRIVDDYENTRVREADALATAVVTLLRSSRAIPDPKAVILFSEGFPQDPGQDARDAAEAAMGSEVSRYVSSRNRHTMREKIDAIVVAAAETKASFFTINPGGASRLTTISAANGRFADNRTNVIQVDPYRTAELNAQNSLSDVATRTGGVALQGADVRRELERIDALSPALYTVGYYPTLKALLDDRREARIRILRKGVRAEYRREAGPLRDAPPLVGSLEVEPESCGADGRRNVVVRLRLDRSSLTFSRQKKSVTANFSVYTRFVPAGRVVATSDDYRFFNISNTGEEHASGEIPNPVIEQRFALPCAAVTIHVTASDGTSGAIGDFSGSVGP
ncbi:MAG TPA: VWA domain-containing protein [Candidatus Polarisedimenticolaceae bacterium]